MSRSCELATAMTLVLVLPLAARAELGPDGPEFQVNLFTRYAQQHPDVAADADGDFVVVWQSLPHILADDGIFARRFSSAGVGLATEFQVSTATTRTGIDPSVAMAAGGAFVVVWGEDGYPIRARLFSSAGAPLGAEFQVSGGFTGYAMEPAVAAGAAGNFVVAWHELGGDGSDRGIFARRFSSAGTALGVEFQVNTYSIGGQYLPAVATNANGDFAIVWRSDGQDGSLSGVFGRRFLSAGAGAAEFQVNATTVNAQGEATVAADDTGNFIVAWTSYGQDGSISGIFARRFAAVSGAPLAVEFQANSYTLSFQTRPSVSADADGDFVVAWASLYQDGYYRGVFARRFSSTGAALAVEFQVNTYTPFDQTRPRLASSDAGAFVVIWRSHLQDGSSYGVFAQRYGEGVALDVDADAALEPLTDGLLVLRYLFGFLGATLVAGAVDTSNCDRCDDASIASYLAGLGDLLDGDGDGAAEPLTDGLLILRYLFGFRDAALVTGAVDTINCTRCDAADIETYLAGLVS